MARLLRVFAHFREVAHSTTVVARVRLLCAVLLLVTRIPAATAHFGLGLLVSAGV